MTTISTASTIATPARFVSVLAHMICDDIDPARFADRHGSTINHPAFVLGHCAYYAGVCVQLLGGDVAFEDGEAERFQHGAPCQDEASLYPDKDTCLSRFDARTTAAADYIESEAGQAALLRSAADTPFAERFETLGQVAGFMLAGHPCFHLGQLSAWRRVAGMGSAT